MRKPIPAALPRVRGVAGLVAVLAVASCAPRPPAAPVPLPLPTAPAPEVVLPAAPAPAREFRGAWVATVANIDWPSRPGLPVEVQKAELRRLLDRAVELKLNAIVFQVRPAADALYASPYEPWSEYLTGAMGRPPEPFYDPLAFAVQEAHERGLELHAWFNPYRARQAGARSPVAATHISRTRPELVRRYGSYLWMDPGEAEVRDHSVRVILDVVRRYDIDGVHLDDYFYPYRERDSSGREIPFPDDRSWAAYRASGGTLARDDWRRSNVDSLIARLYREIRAEKPWVRFGISPFGIWRPGHPEQIRGMDAFTAIYADSRTWLANGWLDYFAPQLYWPVAQREQSYPVLLRWWVGENVMGRHIWPGNFSSRTLTGSTRRWEAAEVIQQVELTRREPGAGGNIHFSMKSLMPGTGPLGEALAAAAYGHAALVPASPWLDSTAPAAPRVRAEENGSALLLDLRPGAAGPAWLWVVKTLRGGDWHTEIVPGRRGDHRIPIAAEGRPERVVVSAVSRTGVEGERVEVALPGR